MDQTNPDLWRKELRHRSTRYFSTDMLLGQWVASLRLVSPGAVTDDVALYISTSDNLFHELFSPLLATVLAFEIRAAQKRVAPKIEAKFRPF